jgi:hypothetical protein
MVPLLTSRFFGVGEKPSAGLFVGLLNEYGVDKDVIRTMAPDQIWRSFLRFCICFGF